MLKGLLQKLRGDAPKPAPAASAPPAVEGLPPARSDETWGNPVAATLAGHLERGDWRAVADLFEQQRGDWQMRTFLTSMAMEQPGRPAWLDAWVAERPDRPDGYLVRGGQAITWAWEARGSGKAETVDERGWDLLHQRVDLAMGDLLEAARRDPEDPTPLALLITCTAAVSLPLDHTAQYFEEAVRRDPHHFLTHKMMLMRLTEKWGGSHDEMFEFVRRTSEQAAPGSRVHELVVTAHFERWLYYRAWEKDDDGAQRHLEEAREEIQQVDARRFPEGARHDHWWDLQAHNELACFYSLTGLRERSRRHFVATDGIWTEHPWRMSGGAAWYEEAREWAFRPPAAKRG